jgi:hypothetical protein
MGVERKRFGLTTEPKLSRFVAKEVIESFPKNGQ